MTTDKTATIECRYCGFQKTDDGARCVRCHDEATKEGRTLHMTTPTEMRTYGKIYADALSPGDRIVGGHVQRPFPSS